MKVYISRHGQTDLNKNNLLQGRLGLPLNQTGIEQAMLLHDALKGVKFDAVYSSDHARTRQTAKIATGFDPIVDARIDVYDLGAASNLPQDKIKWKGVIPDPSVYSGVERMKDYIKRIYNFMDELKKKYHHTDANIFICGHKCTTAAIAAYLLGLPVKTFAAKFTTLALSNGQMRVYDSITNSEIEMINGK